MSGFDAAYYARFYGSPRTRVQGPREVARAASLALGMIRWAGGEVETVLEVGAGTGLWRDWFARRRPAVAYRSTDVSAHAAAQYGHERRDIVRWRARRRYDLVICQGVLPYLDAKDAEAAIENLAAMTRGFLYLETVTKRDLTALCDPARSDPAMIPRTGAWYRKRLERHYHLVGLGLWIRREAAGRLYELERGP